MSQMNLTVYCKYSLTWNLLGQRNWVRFIHYDPLNEGLSIECVLILFSLCVQLTFVLSLEKTKSSVLFPPFSDNNIDINTLDIPVNAVATALKDFFSKRLPPLFTEEHMAELEDISSEFCLEDQLWVVGPVVNLSTV